MINGTKEREQGVCHQHVPIWGNWKELLGGIQRSQQFP